MSYQAVARFKVPAVVVTLIAALCLCVPPVSAATGTVPVSSWRVVSTPALVGHWYAVDYIGGKWIALGRTARIAVSRNGTTWTEHSVPLGSWHSISYGNGLFVSLSSANAGPHEMVSTNGVNWTLATGPAGAWTGVTFGGGRFVAVSSIGQLDTSTDGVHWTQTWVHSKFHFTSVAYGNGRFIAVDNAQGDIVISLNGIGWSFYPISSPGEKWGAVTYGIAERNWLELLPHLVARREMGRGDLRQREFRHVQPELGRHRDNRAGLRLDDARLPTFSTHHRRRLWLQPLRRGGSIDGVAP